MPCLAGKEVLTRVPLLHISLVFLRVCRWVEGARQGVAKDSKNQQVHCIGGQAKLQLKLSQGSLSCGDLQDAKPDEDSTDAPQLPCLYSVFFATPHSLQAPRTPQACVRSGAQAPAI